VSGEVYIFPLLLFGLRADRVELRNTEGMVDDKLESFFTDSNLHRNGFTWRVPKKQLYERRQMGSIDKQPL
jgi:hypothetical protein